MNLTLVIGTCDAYLTAVPNFVVLANRYFEPKVRKLFIGETIELNHEGYEWLLPGLDIWGNRMQKGVEKITTDYIILKRLTNKIIIKIILFNRFITCQIQKIQ
jgi:hypothetical protein